MFDRRAKNESRASCRVEVNGALRLIEYGQLTFCY